MILRRLTKTQKDQIVEAYRGGENTNTLAEKYSCSANTINRTVKTLLSDTEYKLLKGKRLKSSNKKIEDSNNNIVYSKQEDFKKIGSFESSTPPIEKQQKTLENNDDGIFDCEFKEIAFLPIGELSSSEFQKDENALFDEGNKDPDSKHEEIVSALSNLEIEKKRLDFEILKQENLPESVYMLVDKKVELEVKYISDLPEWSFLPENELERKAILLFSNQRSAKRSCSRNQRVIKIPNSSVFEVSKPYLLSKGISRLVLDDSIISLDN